MPDNIRGPFRSHGLRGGTRSGGATIFRLYLLVCLIFPGRVAAILAILAFISGLVGYVLERAEP